MKLLSVNVSRPREVAHGSETVTTGIFKEPVEGRVMLGTLNLDGDGQADLVGHGGIYKAAYAYSVENYEYWKRELRRADLAFGQFGENFTVEGMLEDEVHVGDVFRVGGALVEVTQPRVPCYKLGLKMGLQRIREEVSGQLPGGLLPARSGRGRGRRGRRPGSRQDRSRADHGPGDVPPAVLRSREPGRG